jgi:hypothetical protein
MNNLDSKEQEDEDIESSETKLKKLISNIRAFLKDNLSLLGAAKPGDIRTVNELERHLKHSSGAKITEALQVMNNNNEIRFVEGSTDEFIIQ